MKRLLNKKLNVVLLGGMLFAVFACDNKLDIKPAQSIPTEVALSTSENIVNLLTGSYNRAGRMDLYGGQIQLLSDLYGFSGQATFNGTFIEPRQVFAKTLINDNLFVRDHWLEAYTLINATNLILDHLDIVEEDLRAEISGGAKFLRGLTYFDLARSFGLPYEAGQQNSQLAVPLSLEGILDYDQDLTIARSTVEQVYSQVIADLNDAYEELPETNGFWADKYAVKALLARVYLQQGQFEQARDAANEVINDSGRSLTTRYQDAFNNDANSSEDVFAIQFNSQDVSSLTANQLVTFYASEANGGRGGDVRIQQAFIDMFGSDTDFRASFFDPLVTNRRLTGKYTSQFANLPLIRLAEMYLIRAETNQRLGTTIGATPIQDINLIRGRSNASLKTSVSLDDILLERELELSFEGFLIHDLKRTKRPVYITVVVDDQPTRVAIPYNADRLVFPIPLREMDANNKLVQNPGYGQ